MILQPDATLAKYNTESVNTVRQLVLLHLQNIPKQIRCQLFIRP